MFADFLVREKNAFYTSLDEMDFFSRASHEVNVISILSNSILSSKSLSRYSLEETSHYARRQERQSYGGLDKNVFKGDSRDYNIDEMSAEFSVDDASFKPAKQRDPDEKCSAKQVFHRYKVEEGWHESVAKTLALMDFEKINYELIEQVVVYIAEGGSSSQPLAREGSILIFLPGMAEISTLHDQLQSNR